MVTSAHVNLFQKGLKKYLTTTQLKKIRSVRIGIGGAGGLGSNIAMLLVRSGVQNLEIIDFDKIEPSNLNRQQFFINDIGKAKVQILKKRLLQINPAAKITAHKIFWSKENGGKFFRTCDFVVEAFDQAENKHAFVEFYQTRAPIVISGTGLAGITSPHPLKVQRTGNIYFVGDQKTGVSRRCPPMAPRVTACAAIMAETILSLILRR